VKVVFVNIFSMGIHPSTPYHRGIFGKFIDMVPIHVPKEDGVGF
jgi:hypothetical protein